MDDTIDLTKLQKFTEAACSNPRHPVFQLGLQHSPILQHYAINVLALEAIKPMQWFAEYPKETARLAEVMALCEAQDAEKATGDDEMTTLKAQVADLSAKLAKLTPAPDAHGADAPPPAAVA